MGEQKENWMVSFPLPADAIIYSKTVDAYFNCESVARLIELARVEFLRLHGIDHTGVLVLPAHRTAAESDVRIGGGVSALSSMCNDITVILFAYRTEPVMRWQMERVDGPV